MKSLVAAGRASGQNCTCASSCYIDFKQRSLLTVSVLLRSECMRSCYDTSVCLRVCPPHCWYCIETYAHIVKRCPPSSGGRTLVSCALTPLRNSNGNPLSGGIKQTEGLEILRFLIKIAVYLGNGTQFSSVRQD